MDRTASTTVLFIFSATPFFSGVFATVSSCQTPSFFKHFSKSAQTYSPPLSVRRVFSFLPVDLSTWAFHSRKHGKTSSLWFRTYIQVKKGIVINKCKKVFSTSQGRCIHLTTHITMHQLNPRGSLDRLPPSTGNLLLWCFPSTHDSQKVVSLDALKSKSSTSFSLANFCRFRTPRWPYHRCQVSSFVSLLLLTAALICSLSAWQFRWYKLPTLVATAITFLFESNISHPVSVNLTTFPAFAAFVTLNRLYDRSGTHRTSCSSRSWTFLRLEVFLSW